MLHRAVLAVYLPILAVAVSNVRAVRPSNHGLEYQLSPATNEGSPQMASFFGRSQPPSRRSSDLPLPEAENTTDPSWRWGSSPGGHDRVRNVLLVASLACGVTGGVVLLAAGVLFAFQLRRDRSSAGK